MEPPPFHGTRFTASRQCHNQKSRKMKPQLFCSAKEKNYSKWNLFFSLVWLLPSALTLSGLWTRIRTRIQCRRDGEESIMPKTLVILTLWTRRIRILVVPCETTPTIDLPLNQHICLRQNTLNSRNIHLVISNWE